MGRRKKDLADQIADQILGPAAPPAPRGRGRPPGQPQRPLTEAELAQRRAAAAGRVNVKGRARTVDAAWDKAVAWAAGKLRDLAARWRRGEVTPGPGDLFDLADEINRQPSAPPEKKT